MILTIDAGNSFITIGCMNRDEVIFLERVSTNLNKTSLEYTIDIMNALRLNHIEASLITGSIISCVVPPLKNILAASVERVCHVTPLLASPDLQHELSILIDRPAELGPNILATAVAVVRKYGTPAVIMNLGTATTISLVNEKKEFIGSAILPGMQSAMDALTGGAAQLSRISLEQPVTSVGRNTVDALNGGAVYGNAGMIDGLLDRMIAEANLSSEPVIVATGKLSQVLGPYLRHNVVIDEYLSLKGLAAIYYARKEESTVWS